MTHESMQTTTSRVNYELSLTAHEISYLISAGRRNA